MAIQFLRRAGNAVLLVKRGTIRLRCTSETEVQATCVRRRTAAGGGQKNDQASGRRRDGRRSAPREHRPTATTQRPSDSLGCFYCSLGPDILGGRTVMVGHRRRQ